MQHDKQFTYTLIALVLGTLVGIVLHELFPANHLSHTLLMQSLMASIGTLFINSLKMIIIPLLATSMVYGVAGMNEGGGIGKIAGKITLLYLFTAFVAVTVALTTATIFEPGANVAVSTAPNYQAAQAPTLQSMLIGLIPANPIQAMAQGDMLQTIVFSLLMGIAALYSGVAGKRLADLCTDINAVLMTLVQMIMKLAPIGIFALVSKVFSERGYDFLGSVASYFFVVLLVLFFHGIIFYSGVLKAFTGLSAKIFLRKTRPALITAFSTSSSAATIPVTLRVCENELGVSKRVTSFSIPLGATINMDGTAIMQAVATCFIAQVYGVELSLAQLSLVTITIVLAAIGTAAVPGAGMITLAMVLSQVNLPVEAIGLILGVDRLLDMLRTVINVLGDALASVVVGYSEKLVDLKIYNAN